GYARQAYEVPVRYPAACHPQAWSAGTIPYILQTLLGLEPDGFANRLQIVRPSLPSFIDWLRLKQLRVGCGEVDLLFGRMARGAMNVTIERVLGSVEVRVS